MQYPIDFTDDVRYKTIKGRRTYAPICGVLAVAMTSNVSFKRATEVIKNNLMPHQKRHGGKTYHEQRLNSLRELGVRFIERFDLAVNITLNQWVKKYADPTKMYMATTSGHVVTVYNGLVADQVHITDIDNFQSKLCRIKKVTQIC